MDYNTKFKDPTELTEIFDNNARSMLEEPIGYFYATGQPISSETVNNQQTYFQANQLWKQEK